MGWGTSSWGGGGPGSGYTAPSVAIVNVVPTPGTPLGVLDTVTFDVLYSGAAGVSVSAFMAAFASDPPNLGEVVWDGLELQGYFDNPRSSVTAIFGGLHFVLYRAGGWLPNVTFAAQPLAAT